MTDPHTVELYRQLHDDRTRRLHTSMHRSPVHVRRALGSSLIALGQRLAPEARPRPGQSGRREPGGTTRSRCSPV